ncbi:MAG: hypothetical protein IKY63_04935 [Tidjanibacter sp.]|nr:hypothetical protein [Tidjanibacter sp.]
MKNILKIAAVAVMIFAVQSVSAQSVSAMKSRLSVGNNKVAIVEQSDVSESVRTVEMRPKRTKVTGYTILILSDNSQTARENAVEAKTKFEENFPDTEVKMYYESPSFYVSAGHYLTKEEAIIEMMRFRAIFPKAIAQSREMDIEEFIIRPEQVTEER